jgi:hypothetical protein
LDVFFGQRDVDFLKLDVELEFLFNLGFGNVEVIAFGVRTADEATVEKILPYKSAAVIILTDRLFGESRESCFLKSLLLLATLMAGADISAALCISLYRSDYIFTSPCPTCSL